MIRRLQVEPAKPNPKERRGRFDGCFFPLARSASLGRAPLQRQIFGHVMALFRDGQGVAHALDAACPHRGANLATGRVVDGCLECPYHGWRFAGSGQCVLVPSHPGKAIPTRSEAPVYAVVEQQGIIWVRMGSAPALLPPPLYAAAVDPAMRVISIERVVKGPFEWWLENFLDFSHVPFVHRKSFGGTHPAVKTYPVERRADELGFRARAAAEYNYGLLARIFHGSLRPYAEAIRFDVTLPGSVYIELDMGPKRRQALALLATPETDQTTRVIQLVWRNYLKWTPCADAIGRAFMRTVLREDESIIEQSIVKERLPDQAVMAADGPGQELSRLLLLWQNRPPQQHSVSARLKDQ